MSFLRLDHYQKKLLLHSHFLRRFLRRFTLFQFLTAFLLLMLMFAYPGQNYYQTLQLKKTGKVQGSSISVARIEVPRFVGQTYPSLSASSVFVFDLNSSTVLFEKNPDLRLHPASTTKIMTALVALDSYRLDDVLTVKTAGQAIGNTIKLVEGDKLTVKDLLFGLLVSSANDAAVTLAENYIDSYPGFVEKMNQMSKDLNLHNTSFSNVSGIESQEHKTTVRDLALLTKQALMSDLIKQIVSTKQTVIAAQNSNNKYFLTSTNKLLGNIEGVKGFKTGWTENAGECLITYIERDNHPVIIVVLNSKDRFGESSALVDWIYGNHLWTSI